ncbi:uncharacterized protein [Onthophagus taurus]|uniref:uncharacterized protein n=1 Tax=Onthophagus taurus TaxID=166361 RepID=UPI0039BE56E6
MGSVGLSVAHLNTWLSGAILDNALNINGYTFFRRDRDGRGGGVGIYVIYVRADLHCEYIPCHGDYEQVWVAVKDKEAQLSDLRLNYDFVACPGDANINLLNEEISEAIELTNGLRAVGMLQLISDPTRVTEATATPLYIIAVSDELGVTDSGVINSDISDHDLVFCRLKCESLKPVPFMHTYRDFSQFNYESFFADLRAIPLHHMFHMELEQKLAFFNETLLNLIDCHAPMRTVRIRKPKMPWLTDNIVLLQRLRDEAKTRYKKCRTAGSWDYYKQLRNFTTNAIRHEKIAYFNNLHTHPDKKEMWNTIRGCHIGSKKSKDIPSHLSNVNQINDSFVGGTPDVNTNNIKDTILFYSNNRYSDTTTPFDLHTVDEDTVSGIIRSITNCQPGFVPGRSCTTALLNVTDNILKAKEGKECTALVLLDFSKAFDVVDHDIVLSMLHYIGGGEEFIRLSMA